MKKTKLWLAITGALLVILGVLCIIKPISTLMAVAWLVGLITLCSGISKFIFALQTRYMLPNTGGRLLSALIQVMIGVLFLCNSFFAIDVLAIVFAMWILMESILLSVQSFDYKKAGYSGWWLMLIFGIAGIVLGIFGLRAPIITAGSLSVVIGIAIIDIGIAHFFGFAGIKKFEKDVENSK